MKTRVMSEKEKLSMLLYKSQLESVGDAPWYNETASYLIEQGVTVPPCKIGDMLYEVIFDIDGEAPPVVCQLTVTEVGQRFVFFSEFVTPQDDIGYPVPIEEIGKTVFRTLAEANNFKKNFEGRIENAER